MRRLCFAVALVGCQPPAPPTPIPFCTGSTVQLYDPDAPITQFPDDLWTVPADTPTGLRLSMGDPDHTFAESPEPWRTLAADLETLDGWGTTAGVEFRFSAAVDPASLTEDSVRLVALEPGGPVAIPVDLWTQDWPDVIVLWPRRPLPPSTRAVAAILDPARDAGGGCLAPSPTLRGWLDPASTEPLAARYQEGLQALGVPPERVAAMTVFTTQSTMLASLAVAEDVRSRDYAFDVDCAPQGDRVHCEGSLRVQDYRGPGHVDPDFAGAPVGTYDLPLGIWLPGPLSDGPYPVAVTGHGLADDHGEGNRWSREGLAAMGAAAISSDAVGHGAHPHQVGGSDDISRLLHFFGLATRPYGLEPRAIRDNFRQSAWDRLQVIQAVVQGADLDGDGRIDLDPERVVYGGASLGGMMGTETMALSADLRGGLLQISGGRISDLITESELWMSLAQALAPQGYDTEDLRTWIPLFQAVVDGGDPMAWAPHVVAQRLVGDPAQAPQLLAQYGLNDEIVCNASNRNHATALGLPVVGRMLWPMSEVERIDGPLQANLPGGGTGGIQLIDLITDGDQTVPVDHEGLPTSPEARSGWDPFLRAVFDGQPGTLRDLYADP